MIRVNGFGFHEVIAAIQHTVTYIKTLSEHIPDRMRKSLAESPDQFMLDTMLARLERLNTLLPAMGAKLTQMEVRRLDHDLRHGLDRVTYESMGRHFETINQRFQDELSLAKLYFVDPRNVDFLSDDKQSLFGDEVEKKLPQLSEDIAEAGMCIAFDRPTAAVFHLMRLLEIGVQLFGDKLGVQLAHELNWQVILDQINKSIKGLDHKKSEAKAFAEIAANLYSVKVAWRNEVMHPKQTYTSEQAKGIFDAARNFIRELAEVL